MLFELFELFEKKSEKVGIIYLNNVLAFFSQEFK